MAEKQSKHFIQTMLLKDWVIEMDNILSSIFTLSQGEDILLKNVILNTPPHLERHGGGSQQ